MTDHQPYPSTTPQPPTFPPTSPPSHAWTPAAPFDGASAYADRPTSPVGWPSSPPGPPMPPPAGTSLPIGGPGGHTGRRPGSPRRALAALAVAATFAAGAGGVLVGTRIADDGTSANPTNAAAAPGQTVSTQPGPVSGDSAEPAAAVAAALSPAVVQITTSRGLGSGFVYDESGLILTAAHVTDGASRVEVRLADGTRLPGEVVGSDDSTDVSVVKIDPPDGLPVAVLATGVQLQVGQVAVAIGSPFGLDQTVTAGIVSAIGRSTETPGGVIPAIQTDAPINSGNSGGALADRQGRVIGINDSIITGTSGSSGTGNVGIGFAIPIDIAKAVADRIVAGQSTVPGFLGVEGADATGSRAGAAITSVQAGSPAAQAGVTTDDVVTAVDGRKVSSMIDLAAAVRTKQPGEKVTLTVVRGGDERTVEVTLGTKG
ncbi:MAG: trypsin-like peptidase domain-containing protein [Acidimicrobiales bacterium]|nr:trypsin-like peptidase domain-containing protein [Actinomycetota bacterium]